MSIIMKVYIYIYIYICIYTYLYNLQIKYAGCRHWVYVHKKDFAYFKLHQDFHFLFSTEMLQLVKLIARCF